MKLVIYTANCVGNAKNCSYPNRVEISSEEELLEAVKQDHVCGEYKNNYRNVSNFVKSNVVVMDCDNDHSDDPAEWITLKRWMSLCLILHMQLHRVVTICCRRISSQQDRDSIFIS